jgi:hypothetical protein
MERAVERKSSGVVKYRRGWKRVEKTRKKPV